MQDLQDELSTDHPDLPISIIGVNQLGYESGNDQMCEGRDLPWLQDVAEVDVWNSLWLVTYRDLIVLDGENRVVGIYNVTDHDLSVPAEYEGLRSLLLEAAKALPE